ncbi:hypothetical protein CHLNCDRAFT_142154 [Chlorella variabilis]|uniref:glutamate synthase (ferredoxin) n=1 Tax=Chlorella variabilis TaxID=554065 RepID=E1Z7W6_CHLVA|nr:hypothetical protein CHLNCDRAFT_142154 [Chlorella variabilis]EFN57991.1 hypothetical protein CHLNCDRAFT_142154 [Chlorella variabilis]|eukprot:XP_005850093.1 hypothetical protein CHLNCDRAFT_142154 [Chlorella variabilis]
MDGCGWAATSSRASTGLAAHSTTGSRRAFSRSLSSKPAKGFPTYLGLRGQHAAAPAADGVAAMKAAAAPAAASVAVEKLQTASSPVNLHEVADAEQLLEELDACGVGLIASLKNEYKHDIVEKALVALGCMEHRGACSADDVSGDGAGLMTKLPWELFKAEMPQLKEETTGVGMMFIPNDDALEARCKEIFEKVAKDENFKVVAWREVPVDVSAVGPIALKTMPRMRQVFIESQAGLTGDELERELFIVRKLMEKEKAAALGEDHWDFYACTLSSRTIVYKGMLNSSAVGRFFVDLRDERFTTPFAIYHRRFSTNTVPKWPLAQPMRVLGHNGEINTLQGNLNWVASRQAGLRNEVIHFYEYYEGLQEGWDGPALLVFSDGIKVGARLDRNGLRPARFWQTADDMVYVASEVGVLGDVLSNAGNVVAKGRLGPGQMVCADLAAGTFRTNTEIARDVATRAPYGDWVKSCARKLSELNASKVLGECQLDASEALRLQAAVGYGQEDTQMIIESMAQTGAEPTFCMGDDCPLPVLAGTPHMLYDYFKQRFAQVTNPPIDPLREGLVMSLEMRLGGRGNLLQPGQGSYNQIMLKSPVLLESELEAVRGDSALAAQTFSLHYAAGQPDAMQQALAELCKTVEAAVRAGCQCVALEKGILKILSKMGISLLSCYHGAQIFEAYGLGREVVDTAFVGSVSRIGGMSLADIQRETEAFWAKGFPDKALTKLDDYGFIQSRPKGEYHANNQAMSKLLHKAIGLGGKGSAGQAAFDAYTQHFKQAPVHVLRDMLELDSGLQPVPIEEVESAAGEARGAVS